MRTAIVFAEAVQECSSASGAPAFPDDRADFGIDVVCRMKALFDTMVTDSTAQAATPAAGLLAITIDHLVAHGWSEQMLFLPAALTQALAQECETLMQHGALQNASTGQGAPDIGHDIALSQTLLIRGDKILWLERGHSEARDAYLALMETVRLVLNETLYLGLTEYETHFSFYAPGSGYLKHLDRFRDDDRRSISAVIYLNQDWLSEQGGALRLHPMGLATQDIVPSASRLVLFLSADMLHEVMPATRNRLSLAGWFRRSAGTSRP